MRVQNSNCQPLRPIAFNGIKISRIKNKDVQYLDNKVMDLITVSRLTGKGGCGAVFTNDSITLATESGSIKYYLRKLGIKFGKDKK